MHCSYIVFFYFFSIHRPNIEQRSKRVPKGKQITVNVLYLACTIFGRIGYKYVSVYRFDYNKHISELTNLYITYICIAFWD